MQVDAVKAAYRRYANVYDRLFGAVLHPGRRAVMEVLGCRPGDRVLEVGVGTGLSLPLYPEGVRVTGIDVSAEMLAKARERVAALDLGHVEALHEMDAERMGFPDASFDKVVAMYVAPVVPDPKRLLAELQRVCRPGGDILLVNHVRSANPLLGGVEKALAPLANLVGFHPDFELRHLVDDPRRLEEVRTINLLWKVLRLHAALVAGTGTAPGSPALPRPAARASGSARG